MKTVAMECEPKTGFAIHLYNDVPLDDATRTPPLYIQKCDLSAVPGQSHKAEALICVACKKLKIGAVGFYLFGLQELGNESDAASTLWIPPNKLLEWADGKLVHYQLRIRFIPSLAGIRVLAQDSRRTLDYFYLQCRTDFVNDKLTTKSEFKQEHMLGLAVIDKLRWGKEHNVDLPTLKSLKPWKFIPPSSNKRFKMIWDKKRLSINFNSKLDELSSQNEKQLIDHKLRYINGILSYSKQYGVERFDLENVTVTVDPQHEKFHGIYTQPRGDTDDNSKGKLVEKAICKIEDVMSLSLNQSEAAEASAHRWIVTISRKHEGHPQTLYFANAESALSFMALIDGYQRLTEDFHGEVSSEVFSPMLRDLARFKCFGPISYSWAEKKLIEKSEQESNINYILMQDSKTLDKYIIIFKTKHQEIKRVYIEKKDEKWCCSYKNAPPFVSVRQLLEHYRNGLNEVIKLNRYVPQTGKCDPSLYLCTTNLSNNEDRDNSKTQVKSQGSLLSRIDKRKFDELVGRGHYTEVCSYMYEKEPGNLQRMAVKMLQDGKSEFLESFTKSMNNLTFWKCPTILTVHTICLFPFQVVMDYAPLGDLCAYIKQQYKKLTMQHYVTVAEQVSQALLYLQEYGDRREGEFICHGNIRCSNVFVFTYEEVKGLTVKLGDSGMIDVYSKLPLRDKVNEERIPWVAPELIDKHLQMEQSVQFADIYSFGVFLWEMFSGAERPFGNLALRQIISRVLHSSGLGPPEAAPPKIQNLVKRCLNVRGAERPNAKEIVRIIRHTQSDVYHTRDTVPFGHHYTLPQENESELEVLDPQTFNASLLSPTEQASRVEQLLNLQSMAPFQQQQQQQQQPSTPLIPLFTSSGASTLTDGTQSPTSISGPWDSTTPLIKQTSISTNQSESATDVSADTSHASQDTTNTMLDESLPTAVPPRAIQRRPLPDLPPVPIQPQFSVDDSINLDPERVVVYVHKMLGKGHYGEVYEGQYVMYDGKRIRVAVKSLKHDKFDKYKDEFVKEINMMTKLSHPHVVDIIGQTEKDDNRLLLVMEYVDNGCLRDHLSKKRKAAKSEHNLIHLQQYTHKLVRYAREMSEAMVYLSNKNIVHRDLAARNVLVTFDDHLKISDFGLARLLKEKDYYSMSDRKQEIPALWCAPEALEHRRFTTKTDVWSLGVTFWETFSFGRAPNLGVKIIYLLYFLGPSKNFRLPKQELCGCPDSMYDDIMTNCWRFAADDRLTFEQILEKIKEIEKSLPPETNGIK